MKGLICLWSGAIVDIPAGWGLCDGSLGTPDLRNKFVIGAGDTYDPDDEGGNATHTHTFTDGGHHHHFSAGVGLWAGANFGLQTSTDAASGTTGAGNTLPPYYALAYIMKL